MYEIFDLNGKPVFKIEPTNGMIGYLYHGNATVESLNVGETRKLVREGVTTSIIRDSEATFLVELGIEDTAGECKNLVKQHCSANTGESRMTIIGRDADGNAKRAFDLVSQNGDFFIETKDSHGRRITAPAKYISEALKQLLQSRVI